MMPHICSGSMPSARTEKHSNIKLYAPRPKADGRRSKVDGRGEGGFKDEMHDFCSEGMPRGYRGRVAKQEERVAMVYKQLTT